MALYSAHLHNCPNVCLSDTKHNMTVQELREWLTANQDITAPITVQIVKSETVYRHGTCAAALAVLSDIL